MQTAPGSDHVYRRPAPTEKPPQTPISVGAALPLPSSAPGRPAHRCCPPPPPPPPPTHTLPPAPPTPHRAAQGTHARTWEGVCPADPPRGGPGESPGSPTRGSAGAHQALFGHGESSRRPKALFPRPGPCANAAHRRRWWSSSSQCQTEARSSCLVPSATTWPDR